MIKHQCRETEPLLSGYLDGELTQGDRQRIELILDECSICAKNFEEMKQLCQQVGGMEYKKMTASEKDRLSEEVTGAASASVGQILLLGGVLLLYGTGAVYLVMALIRDSEAPMFVRLGLPAVLLGVGILFVTVLTQRIKASKTDRYKNVRL